MNSDITALAEKVSPRIGVQFLSTPILFCSDCGLRQFTHTARMHGKISVLVRENHSHGCSADKKVQV